MFGDAPSGGSAAGPVRGVLGGASLAAGGRLAGVEGAQGLGLVGLALPVQQLVQDLGNGGQRERMEEES